MSGTGPYPASVPASAAGQREAGSVHWMATRDGDETSARQRRPRGEPRRLLIEAARDLFNRKGYASTSTREIAELAGVSEGLLYRNFRTKANVFREAMVQPFVDMIDAEIERRSADLAANSPSFSDVRSFVGSMYSVFRRHRALAALVFAADALVESDVALAWVIDDVRAAIDRFVVLATDLARAQGVELDSAGHRLLIRGHMAMVAGVATFGPWYFADDHPALSQQDIVDDLATWVVARYAFIGIEPPFPPAAYVSRHV